MVLQTFEEGQNIYVFPDLFDDAAERYGWSDRDKMFYMRSRITGHAAELVWALKPTKADEMPQSLRTSFGSVAMAEQARSELRFRKRQLKETL